MTLTCLPKTVKGLVMVTQDLVSPSPFPRGAWPVPSQLKPAWHLPAHFSRTGYAIHVDIFCSSSFPFSYAWFLPFSPLPIPPLGFLEFTICFSKHSSKQPPGSKCFPFLGGKNYFHSSRVSPSVIALSS